MEELRLYIYQLFERHPLLNKDIVYNEGARWHDLLPALRQMELAGELIGGKICSELPGLQFCLSDTRPLPDAKEAWFWLNSYDPALIPHPEGGKKGEHNYLLFFTEAGEARIFALVKNRGKDLELIENSPFEKPERNKLLPGILVAFFRTVLLENIRSARSVRILTIDGAPVNEHPLHDALMQRGFMEDRQALVLWKY